MFGAFDSARTEGRVLGSTPSSILADSGLISELLVSAVACTVGVVASPEVCCIGVEDCAAKAGVPVCCRWDGVDGGWGLLTGVWFTASRSLPSGVYSVVKCTGCIGGAGTERSDQRVEQDAQNDEKVEYR